MKRDREASFASQPVCKALLSEACASRRSFREFSYRELDDSNMPYVLLFLTEKKRAWSRNVLRMRMLGLEVTGNSGSVIRNYHWPRVSAYCGMPRR